MKSNILKISALLLLSAVMLTALCCCDILRLKYPGEKEVGGTFYEENVDFVIYVDPKSPSFAHGVINENEETLDFTIKWDKNSRFYAYKTDVSDTLFEGTYYASGKLYGTVCAVIDAGINSVSDQVLVNAFHALAVNQHVLPYLCYPVGECDFLDLFAV